tara:strand:- start:211 stop:417 length:207 start_codon:yes stop_codon:yes gene_type:complete
MSNRTNNQLLKELSADIETLSEELTKIKVAIKEAHKDIIKLNMIEERVEKGVEAMADNDGWFWWTGGR